MNEEEKNAAGEKGVVRMMPNMLKIASYQEINNENTTLYAISDLNLEDTILIVCWEPFQFCWLLIVLSFLHNFWVFCNIVVLGQHISAKIKSQSLIKFQESAYLTIQQ